MSKEQLFFIEILKNYINQEKTSFKDGLDWSLLLNYSRQHNLSGIVYIQCKSFIPDNIKAKFNQGYASTLVSSRNRNALVSVIKERLKDNSIPFFMIKGGEMCNDYPHPDLRTMGDTDFVCKKEDQDKISDILVNELGYRKETDSYEWVYYKNDYEFEVHNSLVYEKENFDSDYLNDFWPHTYIDDNGYYHLSDDFHLLFIIYHIRKHIVSEGVGFRQFMDVAFLAKKDINWDYIKKTSIEMGMEKFTINVFTLIYKWFGIDTILVNKDFDEEFYEEIVDKIFKDGIFGHDNEDNILDTLGTFASNESGNKTRIKYIFDRIFPSVKNLRSMTYMSWLSGREYLIPIGYVYRWFYVAFNSKKRSDFIKKATVDEDRINKRKDTLDKWGI